MPADHTPKPQAHALDEVLDLLSAHPPAPPTGRIRNLAEARSALLIPTSAATEVLQAWGVPSDFSLQANHVNDDDHPERLVEFAVLRVFLRTGSKLAARKRGQRLKLRSRSHALWVVYGSLARSAHGTLVIETLNIGPAFDRQFADKNDEIAHGITTELLRLLSLPEIINRVAAYLQSQGAALRRADIPIPQLQRERLETLGTATRARATITDEQLIEISKRYLTLYQSGIRKPLPIIAAELGISRSQARDRIRKARVEQYLGPGEKGRASATIGPALEKLGWSPPILAPDQR